jgi:hypothetical protein
MAQYISASRRNDLPRFHYREFFDAWKSGIITYDGGYGRRYTVSLEEEDVLGYIFWSKDFSMFIRQPEFATLVGRSNAVFHFTINDSPALEPCVPPLSTRMETLERLCGTVGPERVLWRFDPVCRFLGKDGAVRDTSGTFFPLLQRVRHAGISRCYFSFMSMYAKTRRRAVRFLPFESGERREIAARMESAARDAGVQLFNCCNDDIPGLVPSIQKAGCVDNALLEQTDRFGVHRTLKPAPSRKGCGCFESRDIGSYEPPCPHGCVYCYANPCGT